MKMKYMIIGLMALLLMGAASAKLPVKGDLVRIIVAAENGNGIYAGKITDISDGLICLNCSVGKVFGPGPTADLIERPQDICIGTGQIRLLQWIDKYGDPINAT